MDSPLVLDPPPVAMVTRMDAVCVPPVVGVSYTKTACTPGGSGIQTLRVL